MIKNLNNYKLSVRIFIAMVFYNLIVLIGMGLYIYFKFNKTVDQEYLSKHQKVEQMVYELIDYKLSTQNANPSNITEIIGDELYKIADVINIQVKIYDLNGNLLLNSSSTNKNIKIPNEILNRLKTEENIFIESQDIESKRKVSLSYRYLNNNKYKCVAILNIPYYYDNSYLKKELIALIKSLGFVLFIFMILSFLIAAIFSQTITNKIQNIAQKLEKTNVQGTHEPISYKAKDEIRPLVDSYNEMLLKLNEQTTQIAKIEREDAWKEMAKQVAHEIKNPLTPMKLSIQNFQMNYNKDITDLDNKINKLCNSLISQIDKIASTTEIFSNFSENSIKNKEIINTVDITNKIVEENINSTIKIDIKENPIKIYMNKKLYENIITNLLENAEQAIPENREKKIKITLSKENNEYLLLEIQDNGIGIPKEIENKIYEPKFTTKNTGTGLGLPLVKKIIEDHEGSIFYSSQIDKGTLFTIKIPLYLN